MPVGQSRDAHDPRIHHRLDRGGKDEFGLGAAGGMASGQGFGPWRSCRPSRGIYIDGEMPLALLQQRVADMARRLGGEEALGDRLHPISWQDADTLLPPTDTARWAPLNTPEGQQWVLNLCELIQPEWIAFDNVQSLVAGDLREEGPWNDTQPLVAALTARRIGQLWFDHTGWTTTRQYREFPQGVAI